jgi:hypothetical protein
MVLTISFSREFQGMDILKNCSNGLGFVDDLLPHG